MLCCIREAASSIEHIECVGGNGSGGVDVDAVAALTKSGTFKNESSARSSSQIKECERSPR